MSLEFDAPAIPASRSHFSQQSFHLFSGPEAATFFLKEGRDRFGVVAQFDLTITWFDEGGALNRLLVAWVTQSQKDHAIGWQDCWRGKSSESLQEHMYHTVSLLHWGLDWGGLRDEARESFCCGKSSGVFDVPQFDRVSFPWTRPLRISRSVKVEISNASH